MDLDTSIIPDYNIRGTLQDIINSCGGPYGKVSVVDRHDKRVMYLVTGT